MKQRNLTLLIFPFQKRQLRAELKEHAAANYATPSITLASAAHENLTQEELSRMPSQRSLQASVNYVRKVEGCSGADLKPEKIVIVSVYFCCC